MTLLFATIGDFRNIRLDNLNIVQKNEYYKGRTTSKNAK